MRPPADFDGDDGESLPPLEPVEEPSPTVNTNQPTNVHPVTQHDLGFGQGTLDRERYTIHSDPGSHSPTPNQSQSSIPGGSLTIPMTSLEVHVAKAT
eukprot:9228362-Karenia_brevis.AAC.1